MDLFFPLEENFNNLLFNSLITGRNLENLSYLSSCSLSKRWKFQRMYYETFIQTLLMLFPSKKAFHRGAIFWGGNLQGMVLYKSGIMIKSYQGKSFTNAFFSNVNTVNLKIVPNHGGIYTCR